MDDIHRIRIFADLPRGHRYVKWVGPLYYMPPASSGVQKYGWDWSSEYTT